MKTVLITGATGNIGRKLRAHLEATGKYPLRLLCLNPGNDPTVHTADLSTFDPAWAAEGIVTATGSSGRAGYEENCRYEGPTRPTLPASVPC